MAPGVGAPACVAGGGPMAGTCGCCPTDDGVTGGWEGYVGPTGRTFDDCIGAGAVVGTGGRWNGCPG